MPPEQRTERGQYVTVSEGVDRALSELREALQSDHLTGFVESRIRRAMSLLKGWNVP